MCRTCFELAISHLRLSLGLEGYDDLVFSDAEEVPDVVAAHRSRGALSPNNSSSSASCLQHLRCRMREAQNDEREPGTAFDWPPYTLWRRCRRCKLPSPRSSHGLVSPRALLRDGVDSSVAKPIARPALANREVSHCHGILSTMTTVDQLAFVGSLHLWEPLLVFEQRPSANFGTNELARFVNLPARQSYEGVIQGSTPFREAFVLYTVVLVARRFGFYRVQTRGIRTLGLL